MNQPRTQIALIAPNKPLYDLFEKLGQVVENDRYFPRLRDFPSQVDESSTSSAVDRLLANGLPFAVVAVSGSEENIRDATVIFRAIRRRVPTTLIMCPKGFAHMKKVIDVPHFATGHPPQSFDIRMTVLLGKMDEFKDYDPSMFGKATCLPVPKWDAENMPHLAERIRDAARRRITC